MKAQIVNGNEALALGACTIGDLLATFGAIERGFAECGYLAKESSVKAALNSYYQVYLHE